MLKLLPSILLVLSRICASDARPVVHEKAALQLPSGWKYIAAGNDEQQLSLSIALKQPGLDELRKRLDEISDPSHEEYGAHLSHEQLRRYNTVSEPAVETVLSWLQDNSVTDVAVQNAWVRFNATIGQVNELLHCKMSSYHVDGVSNPVYRARQYSLPEELLSIVDYVYPVTQFATSKELKLKQGSAPSSVEKRSVPRGLGARASMPASCTTAADIDPQCIVDLYNITYIPPDNLSNSSLGIAGFLEQYPGLDYIHQFLKDYSHRRNMSGWTSDYNFTVETINGGEAWTNGTGAEANLDLATSMPYIQPLDVIYYSTGGRGEYINEHGEYYDDSINEPWIPFLEHLTAQEEVPQVLSISYTDDEQSMSLPYANRVCDLFMQLGSRGVSVLVASGDGGQAGTGYSATGCYANDGSNRTQFLPTFPVNCPYVTAVGAMAAYSTTAGKEFSSGGFSNYFARPAWQEAAASGYIKALNGSHDGWYNASGRGIPDIAAIGSFIQIGSPRTGKGTSASTPIVASMIALINDKRLRAGKPTLGFLNPLLYSEQLSGVYTDSVEGSGGSCSYMENGEYKFETGFDALPGWDAVAGLGTINFGLMMDILS